MSAELTLPRADGRLERYRTGAPGAFARPTAPLASRRLYAAAHVVADPLTASVGSSDLDWDATLAYRRHLWSWGLGVADAMDTAQRGMGLDYATTKELIERSAAAASKTLPPEVATSSTSRARRPGAHSPSIRAPVPWDLASLRGQTRGIPASSATAVARGSAPYG
ncbi:MAG: DUF993 family protein, partial [Trueperaceae bacterium]|nr:DUF993 family protein [Trueperaceae bacterium]